MKTYEKHNWKRIAALLTVLVMTLLLTACGSGESAAEESASDGESAAGMANPWTEAATPEEASEGAGVGYLQLPEEKMELVGGPVLWDGYQYMEDLAEADGAVGAATMIVRKGLNENGEDVSGDYTEYAYEWEVEAEDFTATCYGNEEGKMMKAIWTSDNFAYSIMIRGQGDSSDTYGLAEEDVITLVNAIQ